ncbi:hypothetical protein PPYR_08131 [Photinus pyralis]|uniref:CRAL-TRIO domain-containing protein n=2 Tax=Photinus pyralis TaxID=7054 RepID=A0A5N4AII3_PHOPY|nr:alpha-tocopherol transfer protein-like isoform X2 [Photinus pyralis]KAB0797137.1 hypothetical protein PPYR_08131 [Photinus pyralis]
MYKTMENNENVEMPSDNPVLSALDLGEPPEEVLDYARNEINEDPDTRVQIIEDFRDLIYERGEIEPHRTDDAFLLRFLRVKKFNIRHAYKLIRNYYEFKEANSEFFENVDLEHLQSVGDAGVITVPPYRDQTGRRVLLYRLGLWDPKQFTTTELFQATMLILELAILEQRAQILGGIAMFDLGGLTMQHFWHMSPVIAKQIFDIMVTSFPMRIECVHIVNQPWIFEMIFNFFKPFLNDQMRARVKIHGENMESLHEDIEPQFLPKRYGGVHPDYNYTDWIDYFNATEQIGKELKSLGYTARVVEDDGDR